MTDHTTKKCSRCGETFPATSEYYWSDRSTKDGLYSRCRKCGKGKVVREVLPDGMKRCINCREIFHNTAEYFAIRARADSSLRGECITCYHQRQTKWREDNQQIYLNYHRQYRIDNAEQVSAIKADWFQRNKSRIRPRLHSNRLRWIANNPEKYRLQRRVYNRQRKARLKAAVGSHTAHDIDMLYMSQRGLCWWCGEPVGDNYHVDHRIPLSRGGSNAVENLCIACVDCNQSKYDKLPWEWNGRLL